MNKFAIGQFARRASALVVLGAAATASQAAIDVSAVTSEISSTLVPIAAIGAGVLLVMVAMKAFTWIRRAL